MKTIHFAFIASAMGVLAYGGAAMADSDIQNWRFNEGTTQNSQQRLNNNTTRFNGLDNPRDMFRNPDNSYNTSQMRPNSYGNAYNTPYGNPYDTRYDRGSNSGMNSQTGNTYRSGNPYVSGNGEPRMDNTMNRMHDPYGQ